MHLAAVLLHVLFPEIVQGKSEKFYVQAKQQRVEFIFKQLSV
jgi:hypothetical protein